MRNEDLHLLAVELPEDILKAKWCGDFARAKRLIDLRVSEERTPDFLKKKLLMEKEILERLPIYYGYSIAEAVALVQKEIPDFTQKELEDLMDSGTTDWIYMDGKPCLAKRFFETLKDVNPNIAARVARARDESIAENQAQNADFEETPNSRMKNESMRLIKEQGSLSDQIRIRASLKIRDEYFHPGKVLVHLPIPKPQINMTNIRILNISPAESENCKIVIAPEGAGARTVAWQAELTENTEFRVEYEYVSTMTYHDLTKTPEDIAQGWIDRPAAEDLAEKLPSIHFTKTLRELAAELIRKASEKAGRQLDPTVPEDKLAIARAFYDYCTVNVVYSYTRSYFTIEQIPEYVALGRRGDCGTMAILFITLCRSAGIPARWQSGLYVTPDFEGMAAEAGMHDWALFYIEGYGWLFADPSFGGSAFRAGNYDRWNYYFGNLDTFRMAANSEFQAEFIPPKQHSHNDPTDSQAGEAEYEDGPLFSEHLIRKQEVLRHERIGRG